MGTIKNADVVIIGAGVIGCAIAYELSKYKIITYLLESESDLAFGASGANTGLVHAGFNPKSGTLKAQLSVEGNSIMPKLAKDLSVPFRQLGALVLAKSETERKNLDGLLARGIQNGVSGLRVLESDELHKIEPELSPDIQFGLLAPSAGIISPYELNIALAESAAENGVSVKLCTKVIDITVKSGRVRKVITNNGELQPKIVINAAGVFSDEVAKLVGLREFSITPRRGDYLVLDKRVGVLANHTLFPVPGKVSKGIVITPTTDGNLLLGPTAEDIEDKTDNASTLRGHDAVLSGAKQLMPSLNKSSIISTFAGIRAIPDSGDFIIGKTKVTGFLNAAGISSPGLTAAPAIAKHIVKVITNECESMSLKLKTKFNHTRAPRFNIISATLTELDKKIRNEPSFGHVICRCEHVTEGEIKSELNHSPKPTTLKGIRYRTRAGMGRCQGGFCYQKLIFILSRELQISPEKITLTGSGSEMLFRSKKGNPK
jgi:glycerol-3-phosphate dehydrogenase